MRPPEPGLSSPHSFSTHMCWFWASGFRFWSFLPKQENSAGQHKWEERGSCLVSSSKTECRNMTWGFNCSGINLHHASFLVAVVTLLQTGGLQTPLSACVLDTFWSFSHRQQCQVLLFSGSDHVLSYAMRAWAAKRWVGRLPDPCTNSFSSLLCVFQTWKTARKAGPSSRATATGTLKRGRLGWMQRPDADNIKPTWAVSSPQRSKNLWTVSAEGSLRPGRGPSIGLWVYGQIYPKLCKNHNFPH